MDFEKAYKLFWLFFGSVSAIMFVLSVGTLLYGLIFVAPVVGLLVGGVLAVGGGLSYILWPIVKDM